MRNPCILGNVVVNLWTFRSVANHGDALYSKEIDNLLSDNFFQCQAAELWKRSAALVGLWDIETSLKFEEHRFAEKSLLHFCFSLVVQGMPEAWDILQPRHFCIAAPYHGTSRCNIVRNWKYVSDGICHRYAEIRKMIGEFRTTF